MWSDQMKAAPPNTNELSAGQDSSDQRANRKHIIRMLTNLLFFFDFTKVNWQTSPQSPARSSIPWRDLSPMFSATAFILSRNPQLQHIRACIS
ncbi:unnamed protein product [Prunus brigantina]